MDKQEGWERKESIAKVNSHIGVGVKGQGALPRTFSHLRTARVREWRQVLSMARALLPYILANRDTQSGDVKLSHRLIIPSHPSAVAKHIQEAGSILLNASHSASRICWPLLWHRQTRRTHARTHTCCLLNIFCFIKYSSCHRGRRWWRREKYRLFFFLGLFVCLSPTQHLFSYAAMRCTTERGFTVLHVY